jgi:GTP diphosphokinase / guanosine-3',5'-bis(diphosphate) 3'-diphosphatase
MGGIKIHRTSCPNANDMFNKFGYRIVKANWTDAGNNADFLTTLRVTGNDDIGIVSNISLLVTKELKLKLRSVTIDSREGMFEGTVSVYVHNTSILNTLIKRIKNVKGVYSVDRIDKA